ncbi:MAG: hypothetical protein EZS28_038070, partial [Streblomastix strix]
MTYWGALVKLDGENVNEDTLMQKFIPQGALGLTLEFVQPDSDEMQAFIAFNSQQEAEQAHKYADGLVVEGMILEPIEVQQRNLPIPIPQVKQHAIHVVDLQPVPIIKDYSPPISVIQPQQVLNSLQDKQSQSQDVLDQKGIFIKNLNPGTTEDDLKLIFSTYQFTQCKIPQSQTQDKPHYGIVDFKNEQDANRALQYSNGMVIHGYKIFVEYKRDNKREKSQSPHT